MNTAQTAQMQTAPLGRHCLALLSVSSSRPNIGPRTPKPGTRDAVVAYVESQGGPVHIDTIVGALKGAHSAGNLKYNVHQATLDGQLERVSRGMYVSRARAGGGST